MAYDYINFSCTLSTVYSTPGLYATLTDCENAVNNGSVKPVLILNPLWSASKKASLPLLINKLGDGYQQTVFQGVVQINEEWSITSPIVTQSEINSLLNQLRILSGTSFLWSPNNGVINYKEFTCDGWQKIRLGVNQYQLTTTFKMTILGNGLLIPYIPPSPPNPVPDPYAANVVLFLKGDGTNGSTNILDSSPNPKTISVFGTAQISTAQSKYGGSSLYFDGTNNCFIGTPVDSIYTLGSSNFTLEMWVYPFAVNPNGIMAWNDSAVFPSIVTRNPVYGNFDATFSFWRHNASINNLQNLTTNVWQHHALVREGNSFRWYLNGVLTVSFSSNESFTGSRIVIGANGVNNYLSFARFYLSHLRLTKAVRYTANFNPETDTYLNV